MTAAAAPRRSNAVLAAFSGPCLPLAAFGVALPVTLPEFYATYVGLELGVVATVFMAVRLIDIVFDPFLGWGMDKTRTRFGRYRPWMALATPMLMLAALMMFVLVQPGAPAVYLFGWLLFLYLGFSIGTLGQLGWAAVLAPQYDQRSRVYGWWQVFNIIGVVLILVLPTVVVQTGIGTYADGVRIMGWGIIIALPVTIGLAMVAVPEPVTAGDQPHGSLGAYLALLKTPVVRKLLIADLLLGVAPGITGSLLFFFFGQIRGYDHTEAGLFMLFYFVAGLCGAPFWAWLATRVGKDRGLAIASLVSAVLYIGATLVPGGNFALTAVVMFIAGLPYAAGLFLTRAMMADAGDQERFETGVDRTGLMLSILSATTKIGHVLALLPYFVLEKVGFRAVPGPNGNSDTSLLTLQILFIAVPGLLLALTAWVLKNYPLTAARHNEIRKALDARDAEARA
ncbi:MULTISPECIES: MFS transporter [unclassified Brevundimonas]|jgi:Na+/melibiose symporter-like transporter|uniref:MFS transporter n=1 Tax=Brevundimonas TaxID=41275 RepID=UPI0006CF87F2|nr:MULTISPECIES: MFS transporter [unclassified Brevundimonas]ALJ09024.1 MFS transporter [Brevundimonas sp. DS20]QFU32179.1 Melibiose carrier protein [Brevundimonas sp. Bb-A]